MFLVFNNIKSATLLVVVTLAAVVVVSVVETYNSNSVC